MDAAKQETVDDFLDREFKQWEKAHVKMKDSPPPDGHDYLKHANNLLALLEAVGVPDINPIAKLVIVSFKAAVMFEQDRRENDARVTTVFLAQTDVMRVLLDVDGLSSRRRNRPNTENLRSEATLNDILLAIQQEIKACGNSIDTYYKESRFVKFWKSQDWKAKMLGHIRKFNRFRLELQQTLSIQVASNVEDLVLKMDTVLSRFFTPKSDWEKNLDVKTRNLGNPSTWIQNTDTLQSLISDTNDPSMPLPAPAYEESSSNMSMSFGTEMQLSNIKKELQLSVDDLCEKNMDMFELKLSFHTQQMEKAIADSANLVIQSLSGPCDRVVNQDLRQLWKEMDWIFCVENKFFISALFEFYLDRFSTNRNVSVIDKKDETNSVGNANEKGYDVGNLQRMMTLSVSAPKFSFLSRLGSIYDPDSWTLEYIALHGHHITEAIDNDGSGFIRISEANAFTQQIPNGWNLPQWCAYSAAGWAYEARIYRRRINRIWLMLTELVAKVLPSNRGYLYSFMVINLITIAHAFTRDPVGHNIPNVTPELRELVKQKVLAQDTLFREHLQSLKWTVEDESTLHLLYGEGPPEKHILQLCTLMMERFFAVACACRTVTLDIKEWIRMASAFRIMREISVKRMTELGAQFENSKEAAEYVSSYHGGIWSYVKHKIDLDESDDVMFVAYSRQELAESLLDAQSILDDFPISWGSGDPPFLHYRTWEEFSKTIEQSQIPSLIPRTWDPLDNTLFQHSIDRSVYSEFPMLEWICDHCEVEHKQSSSYKCLKCPDFDLCKECHELPEAEHTVGEHTYYHPVVKLSLTYLPEQAQRLALEVEDILEQLQQQFSAQQRADTKVNVSPDIPDKANMTSDAKVVEKGQGLLPQEKNEITLPEEASGKDTSSDTDGTAAENFTEPTIETIAVGHDNTPTDESERLQKESTPQTKEPSTDHPPTGKENIEQPSLDGDQVTNQEVEKAEPQILGDASKAADEASKTVIPAETSPGLQFTCGRCSEVISLESEFFRCVGSTCQNYYICLKCSGEQYEAEDNKHQSWHTLLSLRKDFIIGNFPTKSLSNNHVVTKEKGDTVIIPNDPESTALVATSDSLQARISILEEKMDILASTLVKKTDRLEYIPKIEEKLDAIDASLQGKVEVLEGKIDGVITALQTLLGGLGVRNG